MRSRSDYRLPTPYRLCQGCKWLEGLTGDGKLFCQYFGRVDGPMQICTKREEYDSEADAQKRHQG